MGVVLGKTGLLHSVAALEVLFCSPKGLPPLPAAVSGEMVVGAMRLFFLAERMLTTGGDCSAPVLLLPVLVPVLLGTHV